MEILNAKKISQTFIKEYKERIKLLDRKPCLVVLAVNPDEDAKFSMKSREKVCHEAGIEYTEYIFAATANHTEIISMIHDLNKDPKVDGIYFQMPLPPTINMSQVLNEIMPSKDVSGLTNYCIGGLVHNEDVLSSCAAIGITDLIDAYNILIKDINVVIIGNDIDINKPLAYLFLHREATVTVISHYNSKAKKFVEDADIVITNVTVPNIITGDDIKEGATVIDISKTKINGRYITAIDVDSVSKKAGYLMYGPNEYLYMELESFVRNIYYAHLHQKESRKGQDF